MFASWGQSFAWSVFALLFPNYCLSMWFISAVAYWCFIEYNIVIYCNESSFICIQYRFYVEWWKMQWQGLTLTLSSDSSRALDIEGDSLCLDISFFSGYFEKYLFEFWIMTFMAWYFPFFFNSPRQRKAAVFILPRIFWSYIFFALTLWSPISSRSFKLQSNSLKSGSHMHVKLSL